MRTLRARRPCRGLRCNNREFRKELEILADDGYGNLAALLERLPERDALAQWEQQALDKTLPLVKETAGNTQNAIEYFNENRVHLWTNNYREYASNISRDTEQISKTLQDYLKYAKAHDQERQLEQSLGVAGN